MQDTTKRKIAEKLGVGFVIICFLAIIPLMYWSAPKEKGRWIDCSTAEINPDFTPEMREACRKARNEQKRIDKT